MPEGGTLIFCLAILVCLGALGGKLTKDKGRGAGIGWALGLLLGAIGVIVAAVLPENRPAAPGEPWKASDGKWYLQQADGWYFYDEVGKAWMRKAEALPPPVNAG